MSTHSQLKKIAKRIYNYRYINSSIIVQLAMGEYNTAETENVGINKLTEADIADIENKFAEAADRAVKAVYHNSASL